MKKDNRIARAQDAALDRGLDYIIETHSASDFVEVVGSMGGDVITLRIYDDGLMTER